MSWTCATTSWRDSNPTRKKRDIFKHCSSKIFCTASKGDWDAYEVVRLRDRTDSTFFTQPIADNARGCPLRYVLGNTVIRLEAEALYSNVNRERKLVKRRQTREEKLYNNHVSRRLCPFNLRTDERGRRLLLITIN